MKKLLSTAIIAAAALGANADNITVNLHPEQATDTVSRMIYGQFAEHLGACVYEGIWVGEDSPIPNTNGYRNDALQAMRDLKVPVLRWPGGCFADDYHWRDGIGDPAKRPTLINNNWGGTQEDNSFGTHEFFNLCEMLGIEPYLSVNIGSGTVQEAAQWIEYVTAPNGPVARERQANGRQEPWKLKFVGIGNESWGCGGNMTPEFYSDNYRRYSTYMRNQPGNRLYRIASGANAGDQNWTDVVMRNVGHQMDGLSLHYYSVDNWGDKGSATQFDNDDYYQTIGSTLQMEPLLNNHTAIMDRYDPKKHIGLMVDEWGTWFNEEPGSTPGHLLQQNTMRDAIVAALNFNIFHNHADRVRMTNIAQLANVLQTMWYTKGEKFFVSPTYHVFRMYTPHQDALNIPLDFTTAYHKDRKGRMIPELSATCTQAKDGSVTISMANPLLDKSHKVTIPMAAFKGYKVANAEILTAPDVHAMNTFENPDNVKPVAFKGATMKNGTLTVDMPQLSVVSITLKK